MQVQQSTYDLVKGFEGERLKAYKDSAGIDTVGIGHVILPNERELLSKQISNQESYNLFKKDAQIAANDINSHIKFPLTQNQFDALVSLVFNIGVGAFNSSTALRQLNEMYPDGFNRDEEAKIRNAWLAWKNAGGKPILLSRRQKEVDLFFNGNAVTDFVKKKPLTTIILTATLITTIYILFKSLKSKK